MSVHLAPSDAKRHAMALPMPLEAPVMIACLIGGLLGVADEYDLLAV